MTARAHQRKLIDHLRQWPAEQVATLLQRRPDLAHPRPPIDVAELAQRAQYQPSIDAAIAGVTLPENRLLQIVVSVRSDVPLDELAAALPEGVSLDDVEAPLSSLEAAALVWRHGGRLHASGALRLSMPTTLGPPLEQLAANQTVEYLKAVLARLRTELVDAAFTGVLPAPASGPDGRPPRKAELVEELASLLAVPGAVAAVLAAGMPEGAAMALAMAEGRPLVPVDHALYYASYRTSSYYQEYPTYWLFQRALLLPVGDGRAAAQPREVGVALRGGRPVADLALVPPVLAVAEAEVAGVDTRAAARAVQTLDRLADLLERWAQAPAKTLKSGGLGTTVMKQTAAALETEAEETTRLVELAHLGGLIETTTETRKERRSWVHEAFVGPSAMALAWTERPVSERWFQLTTAWLRAEHWPSASGSKGSDAKTLAVLSVQYATTAPDLRRRVLEVLASLDPGTTTTPDALAASVYWRCPQPWLGLGADAPSRVMGWVYAEAELLGMVADGGLSSFGRAVLAGQPGRAETALAAALPEPSTSFTLQADLTATVVGTLDRAVLGELRLLADVESTGAATTLRFSDASLRRALDAGRDGDDILAFLEAHATKGVPKPLSYLVGDVARRYGSLQVCPAGSFVTSDDPAVLADACSHRRTRKLALRLLAPTVAVSPHPSAKVLDGLRDAGFLPVEEGGEAGEGATTSASGGGARAGASPIPVEVGGRPGAVPGRSAAPSPRAGLPEPFRSRVRSRQRDVPAVDAPTAAHLAAAILAGPPGDAHTTEDAGHALAATPPGTPPLAFPHDPFDGEALDWDDEMGPADEDDLDGDDLDGDDLDHDVPATVDELAVLRALVAARPNQSRSSRGRRR